jgi:hypothetical protein
MPKFIVENGMRIEVPDDAELADIRNVAPPGREAEDIMIEDKDGLLRPLRPGEKVPDGARIQRVPEISKGSTRRLQIEIDFLKRQIHGRGRSVACGKKKLDGKTYHAVIVKNFILSPEKYADRKTDILFMLPPEYPSVPALGCYMRYPIKNKKESDHHQTLRAHYGAPELQKEGWYWYCVGLGANFALAGYSEFSDVHNVWKPNGDPALGHNLITLYSMAHRGINTIGL